MKITHRLPLKNWYDHAGHFQLDYPPLEAYIHYLMGFLYSLIDPYTLYETPMHYMVPVTSEVKYGLRIPVIVAAVIFYYPAVICFVSWIFKEASNFQKILLIAILLNMPVFTQIEHMNTQVNSPTLGFLLWSLYFLLNGKHSLCAIFFGSSMLCKQITLPSIIPIGLYILSSLYHEGLAKQKRKEGSWIVYVLVNCVKLALVGIGTVGIIMAPFWNKPDTIKAMLDRLFPIDKRELITTAATLWTFLRNVFRSVDIPEIRPVLFRMCSIIVLGSSLLTAPFIFKKPNNKKVFFAAFAVCGMSMYLFGYYIHEKHLQYSYLGFILNFTVFRKFLFSFSAIISYTLFYMGCINNNHIECILLTIGYFYMIYLLQRNAKGYEALQHTEILDSESQVNQWVLSIYRKQGKYAAHFLTLILSLLGLLSLGGLICLFLSPLRQFLEANSFYFVFDGPFLLFLYIYLYMWMSLWVEAFGTGNAEVTEKGK